MLLWLTSTNTKPLLERSIPSPPADPMADAPRAARGEDSPSAANQKGSHVN
jgi:hypothetical protein